MYTFVRISECFQHQVIMQYAAGAIYGQQCTLPTVISYLRHTVGEMELFLAHTQRSIKADFYGTLSLSVYLMSNVFIF